MKIVRVLSFILVVGLAGLSGRGIVHGAGSQFIPIDGPGTFIFTLARGINAQGNIVGQYADSTCTSHGYLLHGGAYATIDDPSAGVATGICLPGVVFPSTFAGTVATGINAGGDIVGFYQDPGGVVHGFLRHADIYTTFDPPGSQFTAAFGINDEGDIVGSFADQNGTPHGFLRTPDGHYTLVDDPAASMANGGTGPDGINDAGEIEGGYYDQSGIEQAFTLWHGMYRTLAVPRPTSCPGANAEADGINAAGDIVGGIYPCPNFARGFQYSHGTFTDILVPGAKDTFLIGINAEGDIVGQYRPQDESSHGILVTPS